MVDGVNATILYRTVPHVDQQARGLDAAELIYRMVRGEVRPVQAVERLPMMMNVIKQDSSEEPACLLVQRLEQTTQRTGARRATRGNSTSLRDTPESTRSNCPHISPRVLSGKKSSKKLAPATSLAV